MSIFVKHLSNICQTSDGSNICQTSGDANSCQTSGDSNICQTSRDLAFVKPRGIQTFVKLQGPQGMTFKGMDSRIQWIQIEFKGFRGCREKDSGCNPGGSGMQGTEFVWMQGTAFRVKSGGFRGGFRECRERDSGSNLWVSGDAGDPDSHARVSEDPCQI